MSSLVSESILQQKYWSEIADPFSLLPRFSKSAKAPNIVLLPANV